MKLYSYNNVNKLSVIVIIEDILNLVTVIGLNGLSVFTKTFYSQHFKIVF